MPGADDRALGVVCGCRLFGSVGLHGDGSGDAPPHASFGVNPDAVTAPPS
jgi:hypothetical protein